MTAAFIYAGSLSVSLAVFLADIAARMGIATVRILERSVRIIFDAVWQLRSRNGRAVERPRLTLNPVRRPRLFVADRCLVNGYSVPAFRSLSMVERLTSGCPDGKAWP